MKFNTLTAIKYCFPVIAPFQFLFIFFLQHFEVFIVHVDLLYCNIH